MQPPKPKQELKFEVRSVPTPPIHNFVATVYVNREVTQAGTLVTVTALCIPEYKLMLEAMFAQIAASSMASLAAFAQINGCEIMRRVRADEKHNPIKPA